MSAPELRALAVKLKPLRPVIDDVLRLVRCDCPECNAYAGDPLYRPLVVIPERAGVRFACDECGVTRNV